LEGYSPKEIHGIPAKKLQIIWGTDAGGSNGVRNKMVYAGATWSYITHCFHCYMQEETRYSVSGSLPIWIESDRDNVTQSKDYMETVR
jgi:hypothetical protein